MTLLQSDVDWQLTKKTVLERNCHMFNNEDMSDIKFMCKEGSGKKFHAHKYVLATSSPVFHAMFYGVLAERGPVILLDDTNEENFEEFLRFLYTDECNLTGDNNPSILYLAKKYMVASLTALCVEAFCREMNVENVLEILQYSIGFNEQELEATCWHFIERHTIDVINDNSFNNISWKTLLSVLNRDKLDIPEYKLFQAMLKWSEVQCVQNNLTPTTKNKKNVMGDAIHAIKYLSMDQHEFAEHVSKSGLFSAEELVSMFQVMNGLESSLKWALLKRKPPLKTIEVTHWNVRFKRFKSASETTCQHNCSEPDRLCFSVSKNALFHGVRLFGDGAGSTYDATLDIKGVKVNKKCKGDHRLGWYGIDVMLESPVVVEANEVVMLTARIEGPPTVLGIRGMSTVTHFGATVTFSDAHSFNKRTDSSKGQFANVMLSF
jgi:hypothetical protein